MTPTANEAYLACASEKPFAPTSTFLTLPHPFSCFLSFYFAFQAFLLCLPTPKMRMPIIQPLCIDSVMPCSSSNKFVDTNESI